MGQGSSKSASSITVVNPAPTPTNVCEGDVEDSESLTLQELKKFLPILPSSVKDSEVPFLEIKDLVKWGNLLQIATIYKDHLRRSSHKVSTEQKILASRLKDIDLFATGVVHNFNSRYDKTEKLAQQIKAVDELSQLVENSLSALEDCVVLANKLNASLPEEERLDTFHVQTTS
jgi:hypothetical protein